MTKVAACGHFCLDKSVSFVTFTGDGAALWFTAAVVAEVWEVSVGVGRGLDNKVLA